MRNVQVSPLQPLCSLHVMLSDMRSSCVVVLGEREGERKVGALGLHSHNSVFVFDVFLWRLWEWISKQLPP